MTMNKNTWIRKRDRTDYHDPILDQLNDRSVIPTWKCLEMFASNQSYFYFAKKPADLNLEESMFLASIVPNPKVFMYAFDTDGNLKPHLAGFYRLVSGILLKRMVITDLEFANLKPNVKLKGQARDFLRKPLTEPLDSLLIEQE